MITKYGVKLVREKSFKYEMPDNIKKPDDVVEILEIVFKLSEQAEEVFVCLGLTTKNEITTAFEISRGSVNQTLVHPREVFKRLVLSNSAGFIIAHNHPSGKAEPSQEDIQITERLDKASQIMGIKLIDHVIIGYGVSYSFKANGVVL